MSSKSQDSLNPNLLPSFIALLGVLGIFLYYTGWIYRWAYFGFFELELNTLSLPLESFLCQHPPVLAINTGNGQVELMIRSRPKIRS